MYLEMNEARVQELREDKGLSKRGLADVASISMSIARRVEGEDLSNVLHRAGPMLAPITSISTKDNVKNLPTIPGKERNARVEQISSDHPWRSNQARAERPEKNASRYPDDQRRDHDHKPNQSQQRCESPGGTDAGSEPFLNRNAHAQDRQNDTPYYDYPERDVEKPLYTL
jgi:hypothetical protein